MVFFNVFLRTLGFLSALLVFVIIINLLINFTDNIKENHFSFIEGDEESEEQPVTKSEVKEDVKSTEDVSAAFDDLFNN